MAQGDTDKKNCSVEGCLRGGRLVKELCRMHYARLLRHGDTGSADPMKAVSNLGRVCEVEGCSKPVRSRGYCNPHYKRLTKYGDPLGRPPRKTSTERFISKIDELDTGCWEWRGSVMNTGYGQFTIRKKPYLAHRYSHELHRGPIPPGMVIDHLCRNRLCVNPDHLEVVTNEENLYRGKGFRILNGMDGSCMHGHKFTEENTYYNPNNPSDRRCRECARIRDRKRSRKKTS